MLKAAAGYFAGGVLAAFTHKFKTGRLNLDTIEVVGRFTHAIHTAKTREALQRAQTTFEKEMKKQKRWDGWTKKRAGSDHYGWTKKHARSSDH